MASNLTIVIPFYNGHRYMRRLIDTVPRDVPVLVVDDASPVPYKPDDDNVNVTVVHLPVRSYWSGAVNAAIQLVTDNSDMLILNQDVYFDNDDWATVLNQHRANYGLIGEGVRVHPAWPAGYIHGTFMYVRRDVLTNVGLFNAKLYPLWGATCEYQLRAARRGYQPLVLQSIPGMTHERDGAFGSAITELFAEHPELKSQFVATPPLVSIIIPAYNHGRYLTDAVNSLIGGPTSLGDMPGQSLQSFEIIIVDDASTDDTEAVCKTLCDDVRGIHYIKHAVNQGTAAAHNTGIKASYGHFITCMSADDMMEPNRLLTLVRAAAANPHCFVYDDQMRFAFGHRTKQWLCQDFDYPSLLQCNQMHVGILYPRSAWTEVGGYPEVMRYGREDWAFNVALASHGWHGVHVHETNYLYRREQQNRTTWNVTESWRQRFAQQMLDLYPNIYKGVAPMCCGQPTQTGGGSGVRHDTDLSARPLTGSAGITKLRYLGSNVGEETWYGPVTNVAYKFSALRPVSMVDTRDSYGMLTMKQGGSLVFEVVT